MSSTAGEIAKFFLSKSWVVFALSLIAGFFMTVLVPSEWRNNIPLENGDLKAIVAFVVAWAIFYVIFSGIRGLVKSIVSTIKRNLIKRRNDEYKSEQTRNNIKQYLTQSPDKFYWLVEHLVEKDNPWTYVYAGFGVYEDSYLMDTNWFMIKDAPKKARVKKPNDLKLVRQEIYANRYKVRLHDSMYEVLKAIKAETKSLSYRHRNKYPLKWEVVKSSSKEAK